jgi:hypothetical protein
LRYIFFFYICQSVHVLGAWIMWYISALIIVFKKP